MQQSMKSTGYNSMNVSIGNFACPRVLLVNRDVGRQQALAQGLELSGFEIDVMNDSEASVRKALDGDYAIAVLERMMPNLSGLDALCAIRQKSSLPVVLITEDNDEVERILCLELGADDIVVQPSPRELAARIRAILRRATAEAGSSSRSETLQAGPLTLWPQKRSAQWEQDELILTSTEFSLVEILVRSLGQAVSKKSLSTQALSRPYNRHDRTIDVHISNIRHKLGLRNNGEEWIQTIRGFGYMWVKE